MLCKHPAERSKCVVALYKSLLYVPDSYYYGRFSFRRDGRSGIAGYTCNAMPSSWRNSSCGIWDVQVRITTIGLERVIWGGHCPQRAVNGLNLLLRFPCKLIFTILSYWLPIAAFSICPWYPYGFFPCFFPCECMGEWRDEMEGIGLNLILTDPKVWR